MKDSLRRYLPEMVSAMLITVAGVYFWGTAVSTAWARLAALQTIEPYAFAVHEQLLYNFAHEGSFFQTIHKGYDDNWTWSGHRALTLPVVGWLYGLSPGPLWLAQIHINAVMLGAIPAALLGRRVSGTGWGLAWGGLGYLLMPPTMALALQDYQDLTFSLPFLVFAIWAVGSGRLWLVALGLMLAMAPREECIPMAVAVAVLAPPWTERGRPAWIRWAIAITLAIGLAVTYTTVAEILFPLSEGHDMPMKNAVGSLLEGNPIFLEGWAAKDTFYALLWFPLGAFALLAPELALPAAGLVFLHMTVPYGHGVDRNWGGHCHHMAPAAGFLIAAMVVGGGRLVRGLQHLPLPKWLQQVLAIAVFGVSLAWGGQHWNSWARDFHLIEAWQATPPTWRHPAWALVNQLPDNAIPIVSKNVSIAVSNRSRSYTFDESIFDKARGEGLAAGTHLIVDQRRTDVVRRAMAMTGAEVIAESEPFVMITWQGGARDRQAMQQSLPRSANPWLGSYPTASHIPGVPPHVPQRQPAPGTFPIIRLGGGDLPPPPEPGLIPHNGPSSPPHPPQH